MKKKLQLLILLFITAIVIAIPIVILLTTKTVGSVSYTDANKIANSGSLLGMDETTVIQKLGEPDFRLELEDKFHLQYEIERETHALKPDFVIEKLCVDIAPSNEVVIDVYVSD